MQILRFPLWVRLAVLPWLPITAVLFFFTIPRGDAIVCDADHCFLESKLGLSTRRDAITDVRVENDADTRRPTLAVASNGLAHFDLGDRVPEAFALYTQSRSARTPVDIPVGGTRWYWLMGGIVAAELLLVAYYAFAQRAITIELTRETGHIRILERNGTKSHVVTELELADVTGFELDEPGRGATHGTVYASFGGEERRELFAAVSTEAQRGFEFLEAARASRS